MNNRFLTQRRYWVTLFLIIGLGLWQGVASIETRWIPAILMGLVYGVSMSKFLIVRVRKPKPTDAEREQPDRERLP